MILIVGAHPDDESVGAASLLLGRERLGRTGETETAVLHVTDGSPRDPSVARALGFPTREAYAAARAGEAEAALMQAGVPPSRRAALHLIDQEAPLRMTWLAQELCARLDRSRAQAVVTHAYEGGHPDHDAVAFAVHAAAALLTARGAHAPVIFEMTSYHRGPGDALETGVFLGGDGEGVIVHRLDPSERERKRALLACYRTQRAMLRQFRVDAERFRPAPHYDFTKPPHEGRLWYESFPWGMTGERFRDLVRYALLELGLRQSEPVGETR